nr:MAG TPA: Protection of telomeres protein [Caudoviricetes sp.]DAT44544.1 MAG TPA: Protection of telomeres protein [Caudoviricetes sp.]
MQVRVAPRRLLETGAAFCCCLMQPITNIFVKPKEILVIIKYWI